MSEITSVKVRDLVIVVPGIMGSELIDASGRAVWSVRVGFLANAIRRIGRFMDVLRLEDGIGDECPDGPAQLYPGKLMGSLHGIPGLWSPITGYDGLLKFLRSSRFNLIDSTIYPTVECPNLIPFAYDWRLSIRHSGRRLGSLAVRALERWRKQLGMGDAKLILICHSMGGLVARWFAEKEGGAPIIRALITIGTPHRGAPKALATLMNGVEPKMGSLGQALTGFARSLPSLHQLLPHYPCLVTSAGRVSFTQIPNELNNRLLDDSSRFQQELSAGARRGYQMHKVVGIRQPTHTTGSVSNGRFLPSGMIDGVEVAGDGTVPRLAAEPVFGRGSEVHEVVGQHGQLQEARSVLDLLDGIISRRELVWQGNVEQEYGIDVDDLWTDSESAHLRVTGFGDQRVVVDIFNERMECVRKAIPVTEDGTLQAGQLSEGGYVARVRSTKKGSYGGVEKVFLVLRER